MCQIALSQDGQIQYVPITTEQQVVASEDLEAAAHSSVTGMTLHLHTYLRVLFTQKINATTFWWCLRESELM